MSALEHELFGQLAPSSSDALPKPTKRARKLTAADQINGTRPNGRHGSTNDKILSTDADLPNQSLKYARHAVQDGSLVGRAPAWMDEQDEHLQVDLRAEPRLRKLRGDTDEAVLDGGAYEERLRHLHRKLHPQAAWAELRNQAGEREGLEHGDEGYG